MNYRQYDDYFKANFPCTTPRFSSLSTCFKTMIGFTASSTYFLWHLMEIVKFLDP